MKRAFSLIVFLVVASNGSALVLNFDNLVADQKSLTTHGGVDWDNDGTAFGWGLGVYDTFNSTPKSSPNYLLNRHGKNFLGFSFSQTVHFNGAFFMSAMANEGQFNFMANRLRLHYFDQNLTEFGASEWFDVSLTPRWFGAELDLFRVVIEHDVDNPLNNISFGVPDAEWFGMDDLTFNEPGGPAGVVLPPGTSPVPEPGTLLLLGIGFGGMGLLGYRK